MKHIKFVELFAGIGGFRYGLEKVGEYLQKQRTGRRNLRSKGNKSKPNSCQERWESGDAHYKCVWANEWDKYAAKIYEKNFGEKPDTRDIRTVEANEIPDHDLLTAGFPCQAFSIAGHRKGFEDTRGTLFFDIARILNAKRPRLLLLENVKGLLSHDKGRTFKIILSTLDELGYNLQWQVLNSKNFGVPQNRERVFIIGHIRGTSRPEIFPIRICNKNINKKCKQENGKSENTQTITSTYYKGGKGSHIKVEIQDRNQKTVYNPNGISPTFREGHGDGIRIVIGSSQAQSVYGIEGISVALKGLGGGQGGKTGLYMISRPHGFNKGGKRKYPNIRNSAIQNELVSGIRRLTPTECERLQGFPDGWTKYGINEKGNKVLISDTQRYKCLGNAVTTNVITEIGKRLIKINEK